MSLLQRIGSLEKHVAIQIIEVGYVVFILGLLFIAYSFLIITDSRARVACIIKSFSIVGVYIKFQSSRHVLLQKFCCQLQTVECIVIIFSVCQQNGMIAQVAYLIDLIIECKCICLWI